MGAPLSAALTTLISIGCGLGAALCFGTGDFLAQRLTHRHGSMSAMFAVQIASVVILAVVASVWHGAPLAAPEVYAGVVGIGLVNTLGVIGLYRAFESGKLTLVSPIAGSMGAFTVAFAWFGGQPPPMIVVPGLLAVVLGIVAASVVDEPGTSTPKLRAALGVGWALLSAISFGWVFFVLGPRSVALGPAWTVLGLRVVAIAVLVVLAKPMRAKLGAALRESSADDQRPSRGRVVAVACLDSAGLILIAWGSSRGAIAGEIAVVAVLTSSFPLVTIALAWVWLHERLRWWQWLGIATVVAGVVWVSALAS